MAQPPHVVYFAASGLASSALRALATSARQMSKASIHSERDRSMLLERITAVLQEIGDSKHGLEEENISPTPESEKD